MKKLLVCIVCIHVIGSVFGQQSSDVIDLKKHQIVMQFTEGDSLSQATVIGQTNNIRRAWPNAEIEIVCHGPGLDLLMKAKSKSSSGLTELASKGVIFSACNNTMKRRNVKKEDLLSAVRVVPSAMVQLTIRQEEGWAYVKGGH